MLDALTSDFFGYYPGTVALVTAQHEGTRNVMSAGWHAACSSRPPMYGVAVGPERATHALMRASGRFGVNFLTSADTRAVQGAGVLSLHDGHDKFARLNLGVLEDPEASGHAPALQAAYLYYSCVIEQVVHTGDHDWFVGRVEQVRFERAAFDASRLALAEVPVYLGRSAYVRAGGEREVHPPQVFED